MPLALNKSLKTEIYRKALHLSSLWIPAFIWVADKSLSTAVFGILFLGNLLIEYAAYKKYKTIRELFRRLFIKTLRHKEVTNAAFTPSGSLYIFAAAFTCTALFTKSAAVAGLSVMLISDSAAAIYGKIFGKTRFQNGKSLEGSLAFFLSALIVLRFVCPAISPTMRIFVAILAAMVEFFENKLNIDDNFAIPVITGLVLTVM